MRKSETTIQPLIFKALETYKEKIAIKTYDDQYTYQDIDCMSNLMIDELERRELKKGELVLFYFDSRVLLLVAMLAAVKGGFVFVPLNPSHDDDKNRELLQEIEVDTLLTDRVDAAIIFEGCVKNIIEISEKNEADILCERDFTSIDYKSSDPLYIFFTSGSTGKSKAVVGKNESLLNYLNWEIEELTLKTLSSPIIVGQLTAPSHDPILRDFFLPILLGGQVNIPKYVLGTASIDWYTKWIDQERISLLHCVPSFFHEWVKTDFAKYEYKQLHFILMAGETINLKLTKKWVEKFDHMHLYNLYGATETTMTSFYHQITKENIFEKKIPIGKPIQNVKAIILDENKNLCGTDSIGELYIRTPYMSLGYYKSEVGEEKFIPNFFVKDSKEIIYRSGDLVKKDSNGVYEFVGRIDRQVKINGVSASLNQIEEVISSLTVENCAALYTTNEEEHTVKIFVETTAIVNKKILDEQLMKEVGRHVFPVEYVVISKIPKLSNGKIDYGKLSRISSTNEQKKSRLPETAVEKKLAEIWKAILNRDVIYTDQNFLHVGGHSLNIMTLITRINREFDVEIKLAEIFKSATIDYLSKIIEKERGNY